MVDQTKVDAAAAWLLKVLTESGGEMDSQSIFIQGEGRGHSKSDLYQAKKSLGVRARRMGLFFGWAWRLHTDSDPISKALAAFSGRR